MEAAKKAFHAIKGKAEAKLGRAITVEKYIIANYSSSNFISDQTQAKK